MNPSEFLDILRRQHARVSAGRKKSISAAEMRSIRSVVGAWFSQYQKAFVKVVGEAGQIPSMDERLQRILKLVSKECPRRRVLRELGAAAAEFERDLLVPLSRAHWSQAPERASAGRDEDVATRLGSLDKDLGDSYEQVVMDIEDEDRLSYRGPAAELREVLTAALHILAPNPLVQATDWYREARRSGTRSESVPTRAERTKFILRSRAKGGAETEAAESFMTSVEERLASVVSATYKRGSAAAHAGTERDEVAQLLRYTNALLVELLPPRSA